MIRSDDSPYINLLDFDQRPYEETVSHKPLITATVSEAVT